jgi:hypothetical protein
MGMHNLAKKYSGFDRDSSLSPRGRGWLAESVGRGGNYEISDVKGVLSIAEKYNLLPSSWRFTSVQKIIF